MPKSDLDLLVDCATAVDRSQEKIMALTTEIDGQSGRGLPMGAARLRFEDLRQELCRALSATVELEQRAAGVPPPKEG